MIRLAALLSPLLLASIANAEVQKRGPEVWPGKNELSAHIGWESGLTSYFIANGYPSGGTPSGFKLFVNYAYRFNKMAWFDGGVNFVFGGNAGCDGFGNCYYGNYGNTVEPSVGIKLKWDTPIPLVPYARLDATLVGIYSRHCGDNGVALAGRAAGGVKYFLKNFIGVGIEGGFLMGPAFFSGAPNCNLGYAGHNELYAAIDFGAGAEFIF